MLSFHRITSVSDLYFTPFFNLYVQAFPVDERRSWSGFEYELYYQKQFMANVILQDEKFVGLLNYWAFDTFCYIEHFAIQTSLRGKHIGSDSMKLFKNSLKIPLVFEVELPDNSVAVNRIRFYERLGYSTLEQSYAQPPYENDEPLIPMLLMTDDVEFVNTHFNTIRATLYDKVYHYRPEEMEW